MTRLPQFVEKFGTLTGHSGAIYDIIYHQNLFYTASADKFVACWDLTEKKQTNFSIRLEKSAYNLDFSPSSNLLAIGTNDGGIHVVDLVEKKELRLLTQHKTAIFSLVYCESTHRFYSADRTGLFCAWEGDSFDLLIALPFNCGKIREITLGTNGKNIALCCEDGIVRILETEFFNLIESFPAHTGGVNCALFSGDILYTGGKDAHIKKWNWREGKELMSIPAHNYAVYDLEFFDDKNKIVSVSFDKSIKIWNAEDISIIERIEYRNGGHRHVVNRIAKIDDKQFATISDDRKIILWKLKEY